jgi:hypothetical protein
VPGVILTLAAAFGASWLMSKAAIPGRWLGQANERIRPGPVVWAALILFLIVMPNVRPLGPLNAGPYSVYQTAGDWIEAHAEPADQVLDLTDWSLYFSGRSGYLFANVYEAPCDSRTRWIVVRKPHVDGHWYYSQVVRDLIGGREPVVKVPSDAGPNQVQVRIYDRRSAVGDPRASIAASPLGTETRR